MPYVAAACQMLLLVVFAVSVWAKVRDRTAFAELAGSLSAMRLVPARHGRRVTLVLVVTETSTAALLAVPWLPAGVALGVAAALLCALSGGVLVVVRRRSRVPCRCFGASTATLGPRHLMRNVALTGAAVIGFGAARSGIVGHPAGLVVAGGVGALAAALVVSADDIAALFRHPAPVNQKGS